MSEPIAQSALVTAYRPGRFGALVVPGAPGVAIAERRPLAMVQVAAQKGDEARTVDALTRALGLAPPEANRTSASGALTLIWVGPARWLAVEPKGRDLHRLLRAALADDVAASVDLGQSRTCLRVGGPQARAVLAKGCALDFHRRVRPAGHAAQSTIAGINALIHTIETETVFDLYVARGLALSFWEWLTDAAAEFGYEVNPAEIT